MSFLFGFGERAQGSGKKEVLITGKGEALPELPRGLLWVENWRRTRLVPEDSSGVRSAFSSAYLTTGEVTRDYNVSSQENRSKLQISHP